MEIPNDPPSAAREHTPGAPEVDAEIYTDDPELEREFEELAQWLLEAYLYRRRQKGKSDGDNIDKQRSAPTI
jgi:hypothetical protein